MISTKDIFNSNDIPVWFMRQAGRYMKEYHKIKNNFSSFFDMCKNTQAVKEITLLPIKEFNFDAGIIFSDILIILECLDIQVDFKAGTGPVINNKNINKIFEKKKQVIDFKRINSVYKSIEITKKSFLELKKPLIGFSGAPWTVAAYLIEGIISKDLIKARDLAYRNPQFLKKIINLLSDIIIEHLTFQIKAGVDIIQLFDTHSNVLDYEGFRYYSIDPAVKICKEIKKRYPSIPISYFSKNTNLRLNKLFDYIDIINFNSSIRMKDYIDELPKNIVFQGNLDPVKLVVGGDEMRRTILEILKDMHNKEFIFNLGHGVLPQTPTENVHNCLKIIKGFKN